MVQLTSSAGLDSAVGLLERLEGHCTLSRETLGAILAAHSERTLAEKASLLATIYRLGSWSDVSWTGVAGALQDRLAALLRQHPNGVCWELQLNPDGPPTVSLSLLAPIEGSAHEQAVEALRLVFDVCPEIGTAELVTLSPDGSRYGYGGHEHAYMRIPRKNLPRNADTRVARSFREALERLLAARYWTDRLRAQAAAAEVLQHLLEETPVRLLNVHDNQRRRQEWKERIAAAGRQVANLPLPPVSLSGLEGNDPAKDGLSRISTALDQLARELEGLHRHRANGIAAQLRSAAAELSNALTLRKVAELPSTGPALPERLPKVAENCADLLLAIGRGVDPARLPSRPAHTPWEDWVLGVVQEEREKQALHEEAVLHGTLQLAANNGRLLRIAWKDSKSVELLTDQWLVLLPLEALQISNTMLALEESLRAQLAFRTFIAGTADERVLPPLVVQVGLSQLFPVAPHDAVDLCRRAAVPYVFSEEAEHVQTCINLLLEASRWVALSRLRSPQVGIPAGRDGALLALSRARDLLRGLSPLVQEPLTGLAESVAAEFDHEGSTLAAEFWETIAAGQPTERVSKMNEVLFAAYVVEDFAEKNADEDPRVSFQGAGPPLRI